jgi:hypothetical protein
MLITLNTGKQCAAFKLKKAANGTIMIVVLEKEGIQNSCWQLS